MTLKNMAKTLIKTYQLKVELMDSTPPIWRELIISNAFTLNDLHQTIQTVMGWTNSHLHQFLTKKARYGMVDHDSGMEWDDDLLDENKFKIKDLLKKEGDCILYEYDFGDSWEHKITLKKIIPHETDQPLPFCLKGKRSCPPEDIGGVWGYSDFLEKWGDENHPEHEEILEWVEDDFNPESFKKTEINKILRQLFDDI